LRQLPEAESEKMAELTDDRLRSKGEEGVEGAAPAPKIVGDDELLVVPVRKTSLHNLQGYAARKTIEARKKSGEAGGEAPAGEDTEDELTPEATSRIREEVDSAIKPLRDVIVSRADEDELSGLYANEPDAQKYDKDLRAYMAHEAWKQIPAEAIYHHLAYQQAAKAGSKKRQTADIEAGMSGAGGRARRDPEPASDLPDFDSMDEKEFEAYQAKVLRTPPIQKTR